MPDGVIAPALVIRHSGQAFDHRFGVGGNRSFAAALLQARHFVVQHRVGTAVHLELEGGPDAPQGENHRQHNHDGEDHIDRRLRLAAVPGNKAGHLQRDAHQEDGECLRRFTQQAHKAREDPFTTVAGQNLIHIGHEGVVVPRNGVDTAARQTRHARRQIQQRHAGRAIDIGQGEQRKGHQRHQCLGSKRPGRGVTQRQPGCHADAEELQTVNHAQQITGHH